MNHGCQGCDPMWNSNSWLSDILTTRPLLPYEVSVKPCTSGRHFQQVVFLKRYLEFLRKEISFLLISTKILAAEVDSSSHALILTWKCLENKISAKCFICVIQESKHAIILIIIILISFQVGEIFVSEVLSLELKYRCICYIMYWRPLKNKSIKF